MSTGDIRLLFCLPSIRGYKDRVHLVGRIAQDVAKAILLVGSSDGGAGQVDTGDRLEVVPVPEGINVPGRRSFAASRLARNLIKTHNISLVHDTFGQLLPLLLGRGASTSCSFVTSQYSLYEWDFRNTIWKRYGIGSLRYKDIWYYVFRIVLQRMVCRASDRVVLQAPGLVRRLLRHNRISRRKVEWIPNNISGPFVHRTRKELIEKCRKDTIRLLYVGPLTPGKGGLALLDLLAGARERNLRVVATVVGRRASVSRGLMSRRIRELGLREHLIMRDFVSREELDQLYDRSDWLFHVTQVDGSPRVVLEALSRCLPVIGSRHPGIEVLDPEQRFILFAEEDDIDRTLEDLLEIRGDPDGYADRALTGQSHVRANFVSEEVAKQYLRLYTGLGERSRER